MKPRQFSAPSFSGTFAFKRSDAPNEIATLDSSGALRTNYRYTDFGAPSVYSVGAPTGLEPMFGGMRYLDIPGTPSGAPPIAGWPQGLYLGMFRLYDPYNGVWLSNDPLGYVDSPNRSAYVGQNPIGFIDPLGLSKREGDSSGKSERKEGWRIYNADEIVVTPKSTPERGNGWTSPLLNLPGWTPKEIIKQDATRVHRKTPAPMPRSEAKVKLPKTAGLSNIPAAASRLSVIESTKAHQRGTGTSAQMWGLFAKWLLGIGSDVDIFSGDEWSRHFQHSDEIAKIRTVATDRWRKGMRGLLVPRQEGGVSFGLQDHFNKMDDATLLFTGGYVATVKGDDDLLHYELTNLTGTRSFFYHAVDDIPERPGRYRLPMGNMRQVVSWDEAPLPYLPNE